MIRAGAALSLTGGFSVQGLQARRGLELWTDDLNAAGGLGPGERVELLIADDESRSEAAARLTEKLIVEDRVDLLFSPYSSVLARAAAAVAERHGRLLWNHGGSSDAIARGGCRFLINVASPASRYFVGLLALARSIEPSARRLALLHGARGTFPAEVVGGAEAEAGRIGYEVVLKASYPPTEDGLASLVVNVADLQPDVILGVGRTEIDLALARQLKAQRVRAALIGLVAAPIQLFKETLGPDADGFIGPSQWEAGVRYHPDVGPTPTEFAARFRRRFGAEPDYPAAQAYAAGLIAQHCAQLAGSLRPEALRDTAAGLDLTTFYGRFKLDASGEQVGHELVIVQWQGGAKPIIWPPAVAARPPILTNR